MARRAQARRALLTASVLLSSLLSLSSSAAQEPDSWNSARSLELIRRARAHRQQVAVDSTLTSYAAEARGYVYFLLDRQGADDRALVKVDQIALDVFWRAPGIMNQRIVGLRDEKRLPTNIRYHIDHLTLVQDNFGDLIRLGDGDEVRGVIHPAAPTSEVIYDFRLGDSVTITLPGTGERVRVYEVQVRPKDLKMPAFVGSLYVDRETAAIVRMNFTFTPSAYVDPQLDYIRISLENGLWEGKYWLPHEQRAELRRQIRQLDFPVGGVIRGNITVRNYRFNLEVPDEVSAAGAVTALPEVIRESFPFEESLYAELEAEGLSPPADLAEIRRRALELMENQNLSGLRRLRLHVPQASAALRYNRAEGVFTGLGFAWTPRPDIRVDMHGGYAYAAATPEATFEVVHEQDPGRLGLTFMARQLRDMGPIQGASGVMNTLSALLGGEDYLDPYFVSGVTLSQELALGADTRLTFALRLEDHDAATLEVEHPPLDSDSRFRPVFPIDEGTLQAMTLAFQKRATTGLSVEASVTSGSFEGIAFTRGEGALRWTLRSMETERELAVELHAGTLRGDGPRQMRFLLGGRETLPGYPYRDFSGEHLALARLESSAPLFHPLVRARAFGAAGYAGPPENPVSGAAPLAGGGTGSVRTSAGLGLGLGFDILRVDLARGLNGGEWQLLFSVNRSFWDWL